MVVPTSLEAPRPIALRLVWAAPLIPAAISGFCLSALIYYHLQVGGAEPVGWLQGFVAGLYRLIGFVPATMLALVALVWSTIWYVSGRVERPAERLLRVVLLAVTLSVLMGLNPPGSGANDGGWLGGFIGPRLVFVLGFVASTLLVSAAALCALLLATDFMFFRHFEGWVRWPAWKTPSAEAELRGWEFGVEDEAVEHLQTLGREAGFAAAVPSDAAVFGVALAEEPGARADEGFLAAEAAAEHREARTPLPEAAIDAAAETAETAETAEEGEPDGPAELDEPDEPTVVLPRRSWRARLATRDPEVATPAATEAHGDQENRELEPHAPEMVSDALGAAAEPGPNADEVEALVGGEGFELGGLSLDPMPKEESPAVLTSVLDESVGLSEPATSAVDEPQTPVVSIPRSAPAVIARQGALFQAMDPELVSEASALVREAQRASVTFLQRRLRIGYDDSRDLLDHLRRIGVVGGELGEPQGTVLAGPGDSSVAEV